MTAPADDRLPVATYGEAQAWLWRYSRPDQWFEGEPADLPPEARLVCDIFWISAHDLMRDMRKMWSDAVQPTRPASRRACRTWGR